MTEDTGNTVVIRFKAATPPSLSAAHDVQLSVPQSAGRIALRKILYHLLNLSADPRPDIHFLANDEPLRTTLDKFLTRRNLSAEHTLEITYYLPLPAPENQQDASVSQQWLSSVACCHTNGDEVPAVVVGSYSGAPAVFRGLTAIVPEQTCDDGRHDAPIKGVAWLREGSHFLTASIDQSVRLWQLSNFKASEEDIAASANVVAAFRSEDAGKPVSFTCVSAGISPKKSVKEQIAVGGDDGSVWLLSLPGELLSVADGNAPIPTGSKRKATSVATLPATRLGAGATGSTVSCVGWRDATLLSGGWDGMLRTWDVTTYQPSATLPCGGKGITDLAVHPDALTVVSAVDGGVRIIDGRDGRGVVAACGRRRAHAGVVTTVDWLCGERHVVSGGVDGSIRMWDVRAMMAPTREVMSVHGGKSSMAVCSAVPPEKKKAFTIFSAGADGKLAAFEVPVTEEILLS